MVRIAIVAILCLFCSKSYSWGELGHHVIGRVAGKLVASHPKVLELERQLAETPNGPDASRKLQALKQFGDIFRRRALQQAHLANIPDIYWKDVDPPFQKDVQLLGNSTHWFDIDKMFPDISPTTFFKTPVPVDYEQAKQMTLSEKPQMDFFHEVGTLPWRAGQFASLLRFAFENYPAGACEKTKETFPHPTQIALGYGGIMSHKTGDVSQPYHVTKDYDGQETGQKGVHAFFETILVEALGNELDALVQERALQLFKAPSRNAPSIPSLHKTAANFYPETSGEERIVALHFALVADSFKELKEVRRMDEIFSLATFEEAREIPTCRTLPHFQKIESLLQQATTPAEKKALLETKVKSPSPSDTAPQDGERLASACRRSPQQRVTENGLARSSLEQREASKTVAQWQKEMIVDRLAVAAALTADIWVQVWMEANQPNLCWTWRYALKPGFVSPTDSKCFGYATKELPDHFQKTGGQSALPWKKAASATGKCLVF